jgi:exodeoxyribonuclease VIII
MEKQFKIGVYDISIDEYHGIEGISRSRLWKFKQLPYKYWYEYLSGEAEQSKDTEALIFGNLVHTVILEPHLFEKDYFVIPKVNRATKAGKEAYQAAYEEAEGRTLINNEMHSQALAMREKVLANDLAKNIIDGAKFEKSIFWEDRETGILCKARPDIWNNGLIADLKTTKDASPRAFQLSAVKEGYFLQAAMIHEALLSIGELLQKFVFITVEKTAPYGVGIYVLDDEGLKYGLNLFHNLLVKFKECKEQNNWPDYGVMDLTVPNWAQNEVMYYE